MSANGGRVRFFRNVANITMDLNDVEAIDLNALGGADTVTVNDMSGTDLTAVNADLAAAIGATAGDGAAGPGRRQRHQRRRRGHRRRESTGNATVRGLSGDGRRGHAEAAPRTRWRSTRSRATTWSRPRVSRPMRSGSRSMAATAPTC